MSYNLVIVESPNKIKHIAGYLNSLYPREKWEVAASVGHFTELSKNTGSGYVTAGVLASTFLPDNTVSDSKVQVFRKLKALSKDAKTIYLATDADREGEAIAEQLQVWLRPKAKIVRVLYNEITKEGIRKAHENPAGNINMNLVTAQRARRVLDRLVGFIVSPELYRILNKSGSSAGRVQSPVLRLIDDRKQAIINFKPNPYFDVILNGECEGKPFTAKMETKPFLDDDGYFTDKDFANAVANIKEVNLESFVESERLRQPPSALTTSLMQQAASGLLKLKPKQVMKAAQSLFEAGLITYHRTDNPNISLETYEEIKELFHEYGVMPTYREFKSAEGAQEGHPAITPTDLSLESAGADDAEQKLYGLIRLFAIGSQLLPAKYKQRKAVLTASVDGKDVNFNASGSELIEAGFLGWHKNAVDKEDEGEESSLLPDLNAGFEIVGGETQSKETKPPKLYTVKSLLAQLARLGIGRPATLDSIFETLEYRNYIQIDSANRITSTQQGEDILKHLVGNFTFVNYDFTSDLEKQLDLLACGEADYISTVKGFYTHLMGELKALTTVESEAGVVLCPECKFPLKNIVKKGKYDFFACSNTACEFKADNQGGKPAQRVKPKVSSEYLCPECNEGLIHRHEAGKYDFWGCSGFPACKYSAPNKGGAPDDSPQYKCTCGKPLVRQTRAASKGHKGWDFYGCSGYKDGCKNSFQVDADGSPKMT